MGLALNLLKVVRAMPEHLSSFAPCRLGTSALAVFPPGSTVRP